MQKVREKRVVLSRAQSDAEDNHHREEEKPEKSAITREKTKIERTKGEERGGGKGKEERLWGRRRPTGAGGCVGDGEETKDNDNIKLQYVKGHSGDKDNDRVDAIAVAFSKGRKIQLKDFEDN